MNQDHFGEINPVSQSAVGTLFIRKKANPQAPVVSNTALTRYRRGIDVASTWHRRGIDVVWMQVVTTTSTVD
jgi:hypothetical protein